VRAPEVLGLIVETTDVVRPRVYQDRRFSPAAAVATGIILSHQNPEHEKGRHNVPKKLAHPAARNVSGGHGVGVGQVGASLLFEFNIVAALTGADIAGSNNAAADLNGWSELPEGTLESRGMSRNLL
jgi:hypothetical protein